MSICSLGIVVVSVFYPISQIRKITKILDTLFCCLFAF